MPREALLNDPILKHIERKHKKPLKKYHYVGYCKMISQHLCVLLETLVDVKDKNVKWGYLDKLVVWSGNYPRMKWPI